MKKELDWTFMFKMGLVGVGLLLFSGFALGTTWVFRPSEDDDVGASAGTRKTNPRKPLRAQVMSFNTITIFFLLMSVAEFRTNEVLSPHGVDPAKIPPKCRTQQQAYTGIVLACALLIVFYNYFVLTAGVLAKPDTGNVLMQKTSQRNVDDIVRYMRRVRSKNTAVLVEVYPYKLEFFFFALVAIFSVIMYGVLVLANYGVIDADLFRPCFADTQRFYDPSLA